MFRVPLGDMVCAVLGSADSVEENETMIKISDADRIGFVQSLN